MNKLRSERWSLSHAERLRELGFFSLEKRRLQKNLVEHLKRACKKVGVGFLVGPVAIGLEVMVLNETE